MTRRTIHYPINYEVKKAIEEQRRGLSKELRVKISQERFATMISASLIPQIKRLKLRKRK